MGGGARCYTLRLCWDTFSCTHHSVLLLKKNRRGCRRRCSAEGRAPSTSCTERSPPLCRPNCLGCWAGWAGRMEGRADLPVPGPLMFGRGFGCVAQVHKCLGYRVWRGPGREFKGKSEHLAPPNCVSPGSRINAVPQNGRCKVWGKRQIWAVQK